MNKNCLGVLLTVVLTMCGLVPASAQDTPPDDEIWYTSSNNQMIETNNGASVSSNTYQNCMGVIKYEADINEVPIDLFKECIDLTSVILPNSVTKINTAAFKDCTNLTSITFSDKLVSIGNSAFSGCDEMTSITLPNSVENIDDYAFNGCSRLRTITLPNKVKSIGDYAFSNCSDLISLTIGNSVSEIGSYAFSGCSMLRNIYIIRTTPPTLGTDAFSNVNVSGNNAAVYVPETATDEYAGWGGFTDIEGWSIANYKDMANIMIRLSSQDVSLSDDDKDKVNAYVGQIDAITDMSDANLATILDAQTAALAVINFQGAKESAIGELRDYVPSNIIGVSLDSYIDRIQSVTSEGIIIPIVLEAKAAIDSKIQDSGKFTLNSNTYLLEERNDCYYLDELEFNDGLNYQSELGFEVEDFTYLRDMSAIKDGAWQCWYVPFDMTLTSDILDKIDAAELAGILLDGEGKTIVAFKKLNENDEMKANTPYVIRLKNSAIGILELEFCGISLHESKENTFTMQSAYDDFKIGGIYQSKMNNNNWYALNKKGEFQLMGNNVTLFSQRFWLTVRQRTDGPYYNPIVNAPIRDSIDMMVIGDEYGTTAVQDMQYVPSAGSIYNLQGQRVTTIESGRMYIVNGKKYIAE